MSEENSWHRDMEPKDADEVGYIVREFRGHGIEIGGVPAPAHQGVRGVGFMYAEGQLLAREEYLRQILVILERYGARVDVVRQVVRGIMLIKLISDGGKVISDSNEGTSESNDEVSESNDETPAGDGETSEGEGGTPGGNGGIPEGEQPAVLFLLDRIDEELGVGIATPDQVLTAAHTIPCAATEPQPVYGPEVDRPREPYPPVCRGDGGKGVRIYIADTGLVENAAETCPWLHGVKGDTDPRTRPGNALHPYYGHGTFVAGVLRCLAPKAEIYVANLFNIAGSKLESDFVTELNAAFDFAFEVLHLTAECPTRKNIQLIALEAWLELLRPFKGVVVVAPAGNHDSRRPSWPGAFPGVVSVGALGIDWHSRAYFSNYGGWVDVYAPGENLVNAYATGTYTSNVYPYKGERRSFFGVAQWSGTSFSTPIVTGLIAARMARCGESGREAAAALLGRARAQTIPGVGPVLLPCCDDQDNCCGHCDCGHCGGGDRGQCGGGCDCRCGDDCGCGGDCRGGGGHRGGGGGGGRGGGGRSRHIRRS